MIENSLDTLQNLYKFWSVCASYGNQYTLSSEEEKHVVNLFNQYSPSIKENIYKQINKLQEIHRQKLTGTIEIPQKIENIDLFCKSELSTKIKAVGISYNHFVKKELKMVYEKFKNNDESAEKSLETLYPFEVIGFKLKPSNRDILIKNESSNKKFRVKKFKTIEMLVKKNILKIEKYNLQAKEIVYTKKEGIWVLVWRIKFKNLLKDFYEKTDIFFQKCKKKPLDTYINKKILSENSKETICDLLKEHKRISFGEIHDDEFSKKFLFKMLPIFKEMNVKIIFSEDFEIRKILDCSERKIELIKNGMKIIAIDSSKISNLNLNKKKKNDFETNNNRAEIMNFLALKVFTHFKEFLGPEECAVFWMGVGHLGDIEVIDTFKNETSRKRKILGVSTLVGSPSIEIRSEKTVEKIKSWHERGLDSILQEEFGEVRLFGKEEATIKKKPKLAHFEIYEKLPEED